MAEVEMGPDQSGYDRGWSEERWWDELLSPMTEHTYQSRYHTGRQECHAMVDRDPGPRLPEPLPPLEHGPSPLLDASEA